MVLYDEAKVNEPVPTFPALRVNWVPGQTDAEEGIIVGNKVRSLTVIVVEPLQPLLVVLTE